MNNYPVRRQEFNAQDVLNWLISLQQEAERNMARWTSTEHILAELRDAVLQMRQLCGGLEVAAVRLEGEIARLSQEVAAVTEEHDDLDARFTQVLAARAAPPEANTTATARHVEHQEIAGRYRTFVDQEMTSAARAAVWPAKRRRGRSAATDAELLGERLAELCEAIFGGVEIDQERLRSLLVDAPDWPVRLATTGAELRWRAGSGSPEGSWSFAAQPGQPVNQEFQRVWADFRPDAPLSRVVAPAYIVGGRVFEPQRVTTHGH